MTGNRNSYGKRQSDYGDGGGSKRRNPGEERDPFTPGPNDTVYRYLCPVRRIGSIIGRGGEVVKQLRADTHAKIKIGKDMPGCDERVIVIFSTSQETNYLEDTGNNVCSAQDALFRVHERLTTARAMGDEENDEGSARVTVRMLVPSDQIGCIIGKGGQIVQGICSDTGAQIRILKNEHLPACAMSTDKLLQVTGDASVVKKALFQVSSCLRDNPSRFQHLLTSEPPQTYPLGGQFGVPSSGTSVIGPIISSHGGYKGEGAGNWPSHLPATRDENSAKEFSLRLLCPSANIGGVIGKGGVIINQIRQESGASIKVDSSAAEDDCIITVSAKEFSDDPISQTIDAAVRLQPRCSEKSEPESGEPSYTTRLLVLSSCIGCLIGRGGNIIKEMRRNTRANIRILSKENVPKVASEDDEMVQITAGLVVARNALVQIATLLKANFFEREGALSACPPSVPYHPLASSSPVGSKYASRDGKLHGHGYSYSGGHGSSDVPSSDNHRSSLQGGGSRHGTCGGYSGRSGSNGSDSHGVFHGH